MAYTISQSELLAVFSYGSAHYESHLHLLTHYYTEEWLSGEPSKAVGKLFRDLLALPVSQ